MSRKKIVEQELERKKLSNKNWWKKKSLTIAKKKLTDKNRRKIPDEKIIDKKDSAKEKKNWVTKNLSILIIDQINTSDKFDLNE